jgi:hypothetical protein
LHFRDLIAEGIIGFPRLVLILGAFGHGDENIRPVVAGGEKSQRDGEVGKLERIERTDIEGDPGHPPWISYDFRVVLGIQRYDLPPGSLRIDIEQGLYDELFIVGIVPELSRPKVTEVRKGFKNLLQSFGEKLHLGIGKL